MLLLTLLWVVSASTVLAQTPSPSTTPPSSSTTMTATAQPTAASTQSPAAAMPTQAPLQSSTPVAGIPLTYRMQVFTGFLDPSAPAIDRPAADGTRVQVLRLPRPAAIENRPPFQGPCAEGVVTGGSVEITVAFRADCAPGDPMGIVLSFPGQLPITASSEPLLEWRTARAGEATVHTVVVRPIPPHTGGNETIVPPTTGTAGLLAGA